MSNYNHSDEKIEVIDPSDDRYKRDDYFNKIHLKIIKI